MIEMEVTNIEATTLPDAWFQAVLAAYNNGFEHKVDKGSNVGEIRKELDYIVINIRHPGANPMIPDMPPGFGIPPPTTMEYVEGYYARYLMSGVKEANEQYTYGERLLVSRDKVIERYLKHGFNNNQQIMAVGQPSDIDLEDPPCLRHVDTRIRHGKLHFIIYFRSWDLWSGFPANLAAFQLFKQDMVKEINDGLSEEKKIDDGHMIVSSKGLHLYGHALQVAEIRLGKNKK